jgi:hypothetical protein
MELPHRPVRHATGRVELSPVLAAMGVPEKGIAALSA